MDSTNQSKPVNAVPPRHHGFSLVELVVTMLIVSLLAAVAIPGYSSYVRKSRRTEAKTALLDLASLEERYFTTTNLYTTDPATLGYAAGSLWPITLASNYYTINVPVLGAGPPATYTLVATAVGDQAKDTSCATFTVISTGAQSSKDSNNVDSTATCWR